MRKGIFTFVIFTFATGFALWWTSRDSTVQQKLVEKEICPAFYSKNLTRYSDRIRSTEAFRIIYAFQLGLDGERSLDFIATELGPKSRLRYIKYLGNGKFSEDKNFPLILTEHARELTPLIWKGKKAFLLADHGPDFHPFPGGYPKLIVQEGKFWQDKTKQFLPLSRSFNFNVAIFESPSGRNHLLLNTIPATLLFDEGPNGKFSVANTLPSELTGSHACFMTSEKFNYDGQQYVYLGGCDRMKEVAKTPRDRLLKIVDGKLQFLPEANLAPRAKEEGWGTVDSQVADLNNDGYPDIIAAVHNFGFSTGGIQLHLNTGKEMQFLSGPGNYIQVTRPEATAFVPFVRLGRLDDDLYPEMITPVSELFKDVQGPKRDRSFALFKNQEGKGFSDISHCVKSDLGSVMVAEFFDYDKNGKLDIFLLSYSGEYEIFYNGK